MIKRPKVGMFKFTSCSGCLVSLLNMQDEVLDLFDIAYFREVMDKPLRGEFDIAIVEGSISTDWQIKDIVDIRQRSRHLIAIGACATAGGLQALRNIESIQAYKKYVYPSHELIDVLQTSTPLSEHIRVDYELWGCPISEDAATETLLSFLIGRKPVIQAYSLCMECKRRGIPCILILKAEPCLGPVTKAGCGALCPYFGKPCYGCFGPMEEANIESLFKCFQKEGLRDEDCILLLDKMNSYAYRKMEIGQDR